MKTHLSQTWWRMMLLGMAMVLAAPTITQAQGEWPIDAAKLQQAGQLAQAGSLAETTGLEVRPGGQVVRQAVERVRDRLVMLETWGATAVNEEALKGGRRAAMQGLAGSADAMTTGLLVSREGYILTSLYNLQHNPMLVLATLHDGLRYPVKVVGRDETRQVAMLKIDWGDKVGVMDALDAPSAGTNEALSIMRVLPGEPVEPRQPVPVKVGQWVVAVGLGYGWHQPAVSVGIVSATGRLGGSAIQTDAALSPINFGGVLVDIEGRVVGLCTAPVIAGEEKINSAQWYDAGVGFAIPLTGQSALEWMERLKRGEGE